MLNELPEVTQLLSGTARAHLSGRLCSELLRHTVPWLLPSWALSSLLTCIQWQESGWERKKLEKGSVFRVDLHSCKLPLGLLQDLTQRILI